MKIVPSNLILIMTVAVLLGAAACKKSISKGNTGGGGGGGTTPVADSTYNPVDPANPATVRSEEHTSELQSPC